MILTDDKNLGNSHQAFVVGVPAHWNLVILLYKQATPANQPSPDVLNVQFEEICLHLMQVQIIFC